MMENEKDDYYEPAICKTKSPNLGLSATNDLLCDVKELINDGFMTCNSYENSYAVEIKTNSLQDAQKLHKLLCMIAST